MFLLWSPKPNRNLQFGLILLCNSSNLQFFKPSARWQSAVAVIYVIMQSQEDKYQDHSSLLCGGLAGHS